ncbi:MAG: response regulator [Myxococcales bacterium]|nr:response regulator [Myxococcales bacterium]
MPSSPTLHGTGPVIMVDDSADDLVIAERCYRRSQLTHDFVTLSGGRALIEYIQAVDRGERPMPAIVLLDINMPDMTGFEALAAIRAMPPFAELPVIMMLTNSDSPRDTERSLALGASGLQTKPLRLQDYVAFFNGLAAG